MKPYTVKQLAKLSGVTVRTLHYYDQINLLTPAEIGANGYRYYRRAELLRLQQILFYRDLAIPLQDIATILDAPDFDQASSLKTHRQRLMENIERTGRLVQTIDETLIELNGKTMMETKNLFRGFSSKKQNTYEQEILRCNGDNARQHVETARQNVAKMSQQQADAIQAEGKAINIALATCIQAGDIVESKNVHALIARHHAWVSNFWEPNKQAYIGLGQSYVNDTRFREFYDQYDAKLVDFLAAAMESYAENNLA